jgi:WD40 repeat protein/TolB-like protein
VAGLGLIVHDIVLVNMILFRKNACWLFLLALPLYSADRVRIAVLPFEASGAISPSLSATVSDLLEGELVALQRFDVVERKQLSAILKEQAVQQVGCTEQACAVKIGNVLNVQKLVVGTVAPLGGKILVSVKFVDVERGRAELSERILAEGEDALLPKISALAKRLSLRIPLMGRVLALKETGLAQVNLGRDDGVSNGQLVTVVRHGKAVVDETTGDLLGREVEERGRARIRSMDRGGTLSLIAPEKGAASFAVGDRVLIEFTLPPPEPEPARTEPPAQRPPSGPNEKQESGPRVALPHGDEVHGVAFLPGATRLLSVSGDGCLRLWNATGGPALAVRSNHPSGAQALALSPDARSAFVGCGSGLVKVWPLDRQGMPADRAKDYAGHSAKITAIAYAPDGNTCATASEDKSIRLWSAGVEARVWNRLPATPMALAWTRDSKSLIIGDEAGGLRVRGADGRLLHETRFEGDRIYAIAVSPGDGKFMAVGTYLGDIHILPMGQGSKVKTISERRSWISSLAFTPDGKGLAAGGWTRVVRLWNCADWKYVGALQGHEGDVLAMQFNSDGKVLATASEDKTVRVWTAAP